MKTLFLSTMLILSPAVGAAAESGRPFSALDLVTLDRVSDPRVSPDGDRIVFVRRVTDLEADRGRTDLWLLSEGQSPRRLTSHEASDFNPRWSADGRDILFLSSRSGSSQVWRIAADGGEAQQVTDLPLAASNLVVSPTGDRIAFTIEVFPDCETLECSRQRLDEREGRAAQGRIYDSLFVRHWDTLEDGRRSHLFVRPLELGASEELAVTLDVTFGLLADVPSKPFGGADEIVFTPDGAELVFVSRDVGSAEAWSTDFDLYLVPADGSAPPRSLTESNPAWDTGPVFAPDGKTLAYLAMARPGFESDRRRIVLQEWGDEGPVGDPRVLTEAWDRSPASFFFSADGAQIYATAQDTGEVRLFAIDVATGAAEKIADGGHVRSPSLAGERIVFGLDHLGSPVDLYSIAADGSDRRQLTEVNAERLAGLGLGEFEQFSFAGWNLEAVWGWIVKPVDFDPGKKYPLAFLIHGGPQGSFDNDFHFRWNPQVYAGAGYAVVMIDFHGSTGYGQAFTDSISGDWGGKPLEDLQKGLAAALDRYPWIDGERVCALGASYGGYMINWIAGNWSDRFACLVNHDGVFDNRMMYFATEELWFPEWEHGGPYWQNPAGHEKHNPALHVDKWRTPMLVIHGALDYRVPETQGLAAFTALQRQGIPSKFLYFEGENHWVLRPANSLQWHEEVIGWLDHWTEKRD